MGPSYEGVVKMNLTWTLILLYGWTMIPIDVRDQEACIAALENVKPIQAYCLDKWSGEVVNQSK